MKIIANLYNNVTTIIETRLEKLYYIDVLFRKIDDNTYEAILDNVNIPQVTYQGTIYDRSLKCWMEIMDKTIDLLIDETFYYSFTEYDEKTLNTIMTTIDVRGDRLASIYKWYKKVNEFSGFKLESVEEYLDRKLYEKFTEKPVYRESIVNMSYENLMDYMKYIDIESNRLTRYIREGLDDVLNLIREGLEIDSTLEYVDECKYELVKLNENKKIASDYIEKEQHGYGTSKLFDYRTYKILDVEEYPKFETLF